MFKMRPKTQLIPSAVSSTIPNGVIIDSFHMDFDGEEIRVGVVEVPARRLNLKPIAGSSKKPVSLKAIISAVTVVNDTITYNTLDSKVKSFHDGDVIVFVSHNFKNFKRFSLLFRTKARQIVIAYEASKAYGLYREVTNPDATVYNTLAIEECAIEYLSRLDYSEWCVFDALKKLGELNEKESRRFYKALKKLNKKRIKEESYCEESDIEVLAQLTA